MCQVSHLGRRATSYASNWLPVLAPSRVRETRNRNFPKEMDDADIARIIRDYADAALRCMESGLDGIETVTGGHLIGQFLSPRTNKRTDGFGRSLENRARFGLMVHEAIRKRVGDDAIVGIRFVIDEGVADGADFEDRLQLAGFSSAKASSTISIASTAAWIPISRWPRTTCPAYSSATPHISLRWRSFLGRRGCR